MLGTIKTLGLGLVIAAWTGGANAAPRNEAPPWARDWVELIKLTIDKGAPTRLAEIERVTFHLKRGTSFNTTQDRAVEYFTVASIETDDGQLVPEAVHMVAEVWTREEGMWRVQQKILEISLTGEIKKAIMQVLKRTDEAMIVDIKEVPQPGVQDEALNAEFVQDIQEWLQLARQAPIRYGRWNERAWDI